MQSYVVRSKKDKISKDGKLLYYAVPVLNGQISQKDLATEICERSALEEGDALSAFNTLKRLMQKYLSQGKSVRLEGIGTFYVSASSEGCETPEACTPAKVKAQRVCFTADKELRAILPEIKYERVNRPKKTNR